MAYKNAEFYSQDIILRVEDELFKVSKDSFIQHSQTFREMFNIPQPEGIEPDGSSDQQPLTLTGIEKQDFIQLLRCLNPQFRKTAGHGFTLDQWKSVLKLSNLYGMDEAKDLAVECMAPLLEAESPSLQIHLAQVYDVPQWLQPAKARLVGRDSNIDETDVQLIGMAFVLEVCALREKVLQDKLLEEKASRENEQRDHGQREKVLREKLSQEIKSRENEQRKVAQLEKEKKQQQAKK